MGKDPAFLFYPGDWSLGTMHMTLLEKGAYLELLILQFAKTEFTYEDAKNVLHDNIDTVWPVLKEKFDTNGKYFWNTRLREEILKRSEYTESRRRNANSRFIKKEHMQKHMENKNKNKNMIESGKMKKSAKGIHTGQIKVTDKVKSY